MDPNETLDSTLTLFRRPNEQVLFNDLFAVNQERSGLVFSPSSADEFVLEVGSFLQQTGGSYTLSFQKIEDVVEIGGEIHNFNI